jgi:hypothetical protein
MVPELAGFASAARCVRLGIKIKNDVLALEASQIEGLSLVVVRMNFGSRISLFQFF